MHWFAPAFIAAVALVVVLQRRSLAKAEGLVFGGTIPAGCVIAQAIALVLIAVAMILWHT